jgi:quercetin dioxygenase-like cupin family protein
MRKLVTGVDSAGRSCVVEETEFSTPPAAPVTEVIYRTTTSPPPVRPPGRGSHLGVDAPPGIARWLFIQFQPGQRAEMHHTDSIDFDTVIAGDVDIVLDDGAHHLEPGDCVVVTGVDHGWVAGPDGCKFAALVIGTSPRD